MIIVNRLVCLPNANFMSLKGKKLKKKIFRRKKNNIMFPPAPASSLMDSNEGSVSLSLEDLTGFTQSLGGSGLNGTGDSSYEDGGTSFLSSADLSHDAFDLVGDDTSDGYSRRTPSIVGKLLY
jgi:hypothetical protein